MSNVDPTPAARAVAEGIVCAWGLKASLEELEDRIASALDRDAKFYSEHMVRATAEARRAEREACARIADDLAEHHDFYDGGYEVGRKIAAAIRARDAAGPGATA